nr:putative integron gene cassette protein [uncultured bacterium]CAP47775.1 putative integron gene cassette protein [uncultured bacterium]
MNNKKCLLVIDVQNGMFNLPLEIYNGKIILEKIIRLIEEARLKNGLIVFIQYCGNVNSPFEEGSEGWKIHSKIKLRKGDIILKKRHADSFQDTSLNEILKKNIITDLVICGFVTEGCVDTTIRRAYSLGYGVEAVSDCHSTTDSNILSAEKIVNHHNEVFKIFSEVKKSVEIEIKA